MKTRQRIDNLLRSLFVAAVAIVVYGNVRTCTAETEVHVLFAFDDSAIVLTDSFEVRIVAMSRLVRPIELECDRRRRAYVESTWAPSFYAHQDYWEWCDCDNPWIMVQQAEETICDDAPVYARRREVGGSWRTVILFDFETDHCDFFYPATPLRAYPPDPLLPEPPTTGYRPDCRCWRDCNGNGVPDDEENTP